jgi:hypothetical protein
MRRIFAVAEVHSTSSHWLSERQAVALRPYDPASLSSPPVSPLNQGGAAIE